MKKVRDTVKAWASRPEKTAPPMVRQLQGIKADLERMGSHWRELVDLNDAMVIQAEPHWLQNMEAMWDSWYEAHKAATEEIETESGIAGKFLKMSRWKYNIWTTR